MLGKMKIGGRGGWVRTSWGVAGDSAANFLEDKTKPDSLMIASSL